MAAGLGIGRFVYTPILPIMVESLGWSKSQAGFVASANFLGYLVGAMAAARPVPPRRQRGWLIAALAASFLTTAGMAGSSDIAALAIIRFLGGAASAFVIVFASTLVLQRLSESHRPLLSAIHFAGVGAGITISALLVSALLAAGADWRELWLGSGIVALAATFMVSALVPEAEIRSAVSPISAKSPHRQSPARLIAAYGLFGFGYVITATFLVAIVRGAPETRALEAWIWVLVGLAAVPSVALWSWAGARIGLLPAFALACLIEAAGVAASVEWVTAAGVCFSALLLGGTFMGITALGLMAAQQLSGNSSQRSIGFMTASFATGQMIGPFVAGFLFDVLGSLRAPSLAAAAALIAAAVLAVAAGQAKASKSMPKPLDLV